jgi:hypothetical protein
MGADEFVDSELMKAAWKVSLTYFSILLHNSSVIFVGEEVCVCKRSG